MGLAWSSYKSKRKEKKAHKRKLRKQLKEALEECITRLQEKMQLENELLDQYQSDSIPDTETAKADCNVAEMEEEVQALERKLFLEEIAANITDERCHFLDRNCRLLQENEISLYRQSAVCETDLAALKLKQETCQFAKFLQANPVEEWTVCSLPNLYFTDL